MTPQNRVEVLLVAKDNISATIRGMRGNIASGIGDAIGTMATLGAAIAASAVAFSSLGSGFGKAAEMQTSQITSSFTLATMIGSTVSDAKNAVKGLNAEMVKLGDTLPGATENYQKFAQTLTPTIALMSKGDMGKYKSTIMEASKYGGLMTSIGGGDGNENAMTLNRYLSGTLSQGEAHRHELFAKNPTYTTFEKQAMKQMGLMGKDWEKQLTTTQRVAVFNLANSLMFTPSMLAAYGMTADTQFQALKSKLFNPTVGIFGFMREIKGLDGRSSLDAIMTFMGQANTMGDEAGKWLSAHGINLDPMEAIGHMMDSASGWASAFTALMKGDKSGIKTMLADLGKGFKTLDPKKVGNMMSSFMNSMGSIFMSIDVAMVIGAINGAMSAISTAISGVNWSEAGTKLGDTINKAITAFDFKGAEVMLSKALNAFFDGITGLLNRVISKPINEGLGRLTGGRAGGDEGKKAYEDKPNAIQEGLWDFGRWVTGNDKPKSNLRSSLPSGDSLSSLPQLGQMSNTGGTSSFNPVINITGMAGDSAKQMADYVMVAFNEKYMQYRDASLV